TLATGQWDVVSNWPLVWEFRMASPIPSAREELATSADVRRAPQLVFPAHPHLEGGARDLWHRQPNSLGGASQTNIDPSRIHWSVSPRTQRCPRAKAVGWPRDEEGAGIGNANCPRRTGPVRPGYST